MKANELLNKIKSGFSSKGFTDSVYFIQFPDKAILSKTGYENTERQGMSYEGCTIIAETVYRHNGTKEDISVDVMLYVWKNGRGNLILKERANTRMSNRQIENRINKIIKAFNENALIAP